MIWSYLKIGFFGFGGGYAMLTLIERETVGNGWLSEGEFTDIVAISQMTPGPIGINSATYIGYVVAGVLGSLVCTLTIMLPSFVLVTAAERYISRHRESPLISGVMRGVRPVVPGLIASAALLLLNGDNFGTTWQDVAISTGICLAAFAAVKLTDLHPMLVIAAAGIVGWLIYGIL